MRPTSMEMEFAKCDYVVLRGSRGAFSPVEVTDV
jgi:hypothetical protein